MLFSCGSDESLSDSDIKQNDSTSTNVANNGEAQIITPEVDQEIKEYENNGIKLTEIKAEQSEATLTLNTKTFLEGVNKLNFQVDGVKDYKVAYLSNNYYLSQFESNVFEMEFLYGNNVFLAFLIDKNGIAIKSNKGSVLQNAVVGDMENMFDMNGPHLFYYLPQTTTEQAILDFYLVNTTIGKGNSVKVTINNTEFIIDKWAAYKISGALNPENTIRIQLINEKGVLIEGPFNDSGERSFSLISSAS